MLTLASGQPGDHDVVLDDYHGGANEITFKFLKEVLLLLHLDRWFRGPYLTHCRLRTAFLGIALLTFLLPVAEAQVSAYGMVAYSSYGFSYQNQGYSFDNDTASIGGGAFYNFPIHSRLTAGIDGRVLYGPASRGGTTADAALRIGFVPTKVPLRPYFEIGGGVVSALSYPSVAAQRVTNGAGEFLSGLDIRLTDSVDFRGIEYGVAVGSSGNGRAAGVAFLDSGIVYHFRPKDSGSKPKP
jgi:hypothetical protein